MTNEAMMVLKAVGKSGASEDRIVEVTRLPLSQVQQLVNLLVSHGFILTNNKVATLTLKYNKGTPLWKDMKKALQTINMEE